MSKDFLNGDNKTETLIKANTVEPNKTTEEIVRENTGLDRENRDPIITPETSMFNNAFNAEAVGMRQGDRDAITQLQGEGYTPDEILDVLTPEERDQYQQMREAKNRETADVIIKANTVEPNKTTEEIVRESTGLDRENRDPIITPETSIFNNAFKAEAVDMRQGDRDAITQLQGEGYTPDEILDVLTPEESDQYQQMREAKNRKTADAIIKANTVEPNKTTEEIVRESTGLDRENRDPIITPETSMFNNESDKTNVDNEELVDDASAPSGIESSVTSNGTNSPRDDFYKAMNEFFESDPRNTKNNSDDIDNNSNGAGNRDNTNDGFNINWDSIDTITAATIRIAEIEKELEERKNNPYRQYTDEELQKLQEELDAKINEGWRKSAGENGGQISNDGWQELLDQQKLIQSELEERKNNPFVNLSNEELANRSSELENALAAIDQYNRNIEIDEQVKTLQKQLESIQTNKYKLMADDELDEVYNKFDEEYQFRVHKESALESHDDDFMTEYLAVRDEKKLREERPYARYTDAQLADLKLKTDAEINDAWQYSVHDAGGKVANDLDELNKRNNQLNEELQRRSNPEYKPDYIEVYSKSEDELRQEIIDLEAQKKDVGDVDLSKRDEYVQELEGLKDEQLRRKFTNVNDEDLNKKLEDLKEKDGKSKFFANGKEVEGLFDFKNIQLADGDYVSEQEIMDAIEKEFENLGPNEVVVSKKTGEKIDVEAVKQAIVDAANQDSMLELSGNKPKTKTHDIRAKEAGANNSFVNPGEDGSKEFIVPQNIDDLPDDRYIRKNVVKDILDDLKKTTEPDEKVEDLDIDNKGLRKRITDMLDKYYGNRKKEKIYKEYLDEYKEHIITGEDGITRVVFGNSKEEIDRKKELEDFLQLEDFGYKIESLSMIQHADDKIRAEGMSRYYAMVDAYNEMGYTWPTKDDGSELSNEEKVNLLIANDENYVETYNNAYNQHLATYTHLKTLGKHGEKAPYAELKAVKDKDGKIQPKVIFANAGKCVMNTFIFGRNYIKAPIHKLVGTYVAAPIHKLLFNADEKTAGLYKSLPTHRYAARRDYFEQEFMRNFALENEKLKADGKPEKSFGLAAFIKMTNYARYHALVDYKKGNAMVLAAGAKDIEDFEYEKAWFRAHIKEFKNSKKAEIARLNQEADSILAKIDNATNENDKKALNEQLKVVRSQIKVAETQLDMPLSTIKNTQNDAISMVQHNRQNKSNVTHVVTGVKTAARIAIGLGIKGHLKRQITEQTKRIIPGKTITHTHEEITKDGMQDLTVGDFMKASKNSQVSYHTQGGRLVSRLDEYPRGISYKGYSGTDGIGYDVFPSNGPRISSVELSAPITKDSKVFETAASIISKYTGKNVTADQLIDEAMATGDPLGFVNSKLSIWTSPFQSGMARGWLGGFEATPDLVKAASTIVETVEKIPGHTGTVKTVVEKLNPAVVAAYIAMGAGEANDLYDEARRTNYEQPKEVSSDILDDEHRKDSKKTYQERNPEEENPYGFVGTKDGDKVTNYNEKDIRRQAEESVGNNHDNDIDPQQPDAGNDHENDVQPQQPDVGNDHENDVQPQQPDAENDHENDVQPQQPDVEDSHENDVQPQQPDVEESHENDVQPQQPDAENDHENDVQPQQPDAENDHENDMQPQQPDNKRKPMSEDDFIRLMEQQKGLDSNSNDNVQSEGRRR